MHDLACVVHLHSLHSDGTGTVPEIAKAAEASGVDVVLLTDHDSLGARKHGEEGWHGSVLVLAGEEVSPPEGNHFLAFETDRVIDHRGLDSAGICAAVHAAGGFGFAAHPLSSGNPNFDRSRPMPWYDLECEGLDGLELWSFVTDTAERLGGVGEGLRFVVAPGRVVDHPPPENLAVWDRLNRTRRLVAIGGLDAHQIGKRIGPVVLRLMSYRRSFRYLRTHVLADEALSGDVEHDRDLVFGALRAGRCYLAMDSIAPASGFRFGAEGEDGVLQMGAEAPAGRYVLRVAAPASARLALLRDGERIAGAEGTALEHEVDAPGAYRVEARRDSRGAERTWILSNPVYLR